MLVMLRILCLKQYANELQKCEAITHITLFCLTNKKNYMEDIIPKGNYKGYEIFFDLYTCKYFVYYKNKKHTSVNLDLLKKKIETFKQ